MKSRECMPPHLRGDRPASGARRRPTSRWAARGAVLVFVGLATGCTPPLRVEPLDPLPLNQAVETITDNARRIRGVLKADGRVVANVRTPQGRIRTFDLEGILIYAPPDHLRFSLNHDLAGPQLVVGANDVLYWYVNIPDEEHRVRRLAELVGRKDPDLPVQPRQVIEAMGLCGLPDAAELHPIRRPLQRVEDRAQQLLFLEGDESKGLRLEKEYWLSRAAPRVIERIVFRDAMGRVEMESRLSEHQALGDGGPLVPFRIVVEWPLEGSRIDFTISRWQMMPGKGKDLPAFQPPPR